MFLLGIDIGTTNCKVVLYDESGNSIEEGSFSSPVHEPVYGWTEYNPETLWEKLSNCIKQLLTKDDRGKKVIALGISSQGESGLLVDKNNCPLTNIITWTDNRTVQIAEEWEELISKKELFQITGLEQRFIWSLFKIIWLKRNKPDVYNRADKWHCIPDYLARKMTGSIVMEYSIACRTMGLNIKSKTWSEYLIKEKAGISMELFPALIQAGEPLGTMMPRVAQELGMSEDVIVTLAGQDHLCGCAGIGANHSKEVIASIGTSESVCLYNDYFALNQINGYTSGIHVLPDAWNQMGSIPAAGGTIQWAVKSLLNLELNENGYKEFERLAEESEAGARGVMFLPHLRGSCTPVIDPDSKGVFIGMTIETTTTDLCRAVIEGLVYEFRLILEEAKNMNEVDTILVTGGGTKNTLWMQLKADILNRVIKVVEVEDEVTPGAALLGGKAAGIYDEIPSDYIQSKVKKTYTPNDMNYPKYNQIYRNVYIDLYKNLNEIFKKIKGVAE